MTDEQHAGKAHDGDAGIVKAGRAVEHGHRAGFDPAPAGTRVLGAVKVAAQAERQQRLARQRQHTEERSLVWGAELTPVRAAVVGAVQVPGLAGDIQV